MNGVRIIAAERRRQISEEGWTLQHDDAHSRGEMAYAAAAYAIPEDGRDYKHALTPAEWPWDDDWWKPNPGDRVRELAKAGALIAAEIDRLARLSAANGPVSADKAGER